MGLTKMMMSSRGLTFITFLSIPVGVFLLIFFSSPVYSESEKKNIPTDELLNLTITDLKSRMEEMTKYNQILKAKNDSLRKRISVLKDQVKEMQTRKINLFDGNVNLTELIKSQTKETDLFEKKKQGLQASESRFIHEQELLEKQIVQAQDDLDELKGRFASLDEDVSKLKLKVQKEKVTLQAKLEKEKFQLLENLKKIRNTNTQKERGIEVQKKRHSSFFDIKEELERKRDLLIEEFEIGQKGVNEATAEYEKLNEASQSIEAFQKSLVLSQGSEIKELKTLMERLDQSLKELIESKQLIQSQYLNDQKQTEELKTILEQERQSLLTKHKVFHLTLTLNQQLKDIFFRKEELELEKNNLQNQIEDFKNQNDQLKNQLFEQQEFNKRSGREGEILRKDIGSLQKQRDSLINQSKKIHEQRSRQQEDRNVKQINDLDSKIQMAKKKKESLKKELENFEILIRELSEKNKQLNQTLEAEKKAVVSLRDEHTLKEKKLKQAHGPQYTEINEMTEEIESLRLRGAVLSSSLAVIESRYNEDELAVEEFKKEEQQLYDYLLVLKLENENLKEKINAGQVAFNALKEKRDFLKSRGH